MTRLTPRRQRARQHIALVQVALLLGAVVLAFAGRGGHEPHPALETAQVVLDATSNPRGARRVGKKNSQAATYMNRNAGLGIPSPAFSVHKDARAESCAASIQRAVDSRIRSEEGICWKVPEEAIHDLLEVVGDPSFGFRFVIIYLRVSTEDQREDSDSLQDQLRDILTTTVGEGLVPLYIVWENASGKHYDREGLRRVFGLVDEHKESDTPIGAVAVWKMNRFGRLAIEGMVKLQDLNNLGALLLYRRRSGGRIRLADLQDPDEKGDAWDALFEAEEQGREIADGQKRGYQGDANKGRAYAPRSWLLYETRPFLKGTRYEDIEKPEAVYIPHPHQRGQVALDHYLFKRPDARQIWEELLSIARQCVAGEPVGFQGLAAFAAKHGFTLGELREDLSRPTPRGYYQSGTTVSENPIERLQIATATEQCDREFALVEGLLDTIERKGPANRTPKSVQVVHETSMTYVYVTSAHDICPRCTKIVDKETGRKCGRPGDFVSTNKEENHRGNDLFRCGEHTFTVPNDRVLLAIRDGRPPECHGCHRFEFYAPSRLVTLDGVPFSLLHCKECGADAYCTYMSDPARRAAIERRLEREGINATFSEKFDLRRKGELSSGQVSRAASQGTVGRRGRSTPRERSEKASSPGAAQPSAAGGPRQTSLDSRSQDEAAV